MITLQTHSRPKIALENIVVHKFLIFSKNGQVTTPRMGMTVSGNILVPKGNYDLMDLLDDFVFGRPSGECIGSGWIHVYPGPGEFDLEEFLKSIRFKVSGIIPKGTLYWEGQNGEMAARKVILDKKIFDTVIEEYKQYYNK